MNELWSYNTSVREASRILGFLEVAKIIDGEIWDNDTQKKFQILLIQHRQYLSNADDTMVKKKLSKKQIEILADKNRDMSYDEAKDIFDTKDYKDSPIRGRQSMAVLDKLGLVGYERRNDNKILHISEIGNKLLNNEITIEDFFLDSLIKFQYPNPNCDSNKDFNTKPLINIMRLIKEVNRLCIEKKQRAKGLTRVEFGMFGLSLKSFEDVNNVAVKVLEFREECNKYTKPKELKAFITQYAKTYLSDYKNPEKNIYEYTDNIMRYVRMTKYFITRGKYNNICYDLQPTRSIEIDKILENDDGHALIFDTKDKWEKYLGKYGSYTLPFETDDSLKEIFNKIVTDINNLSNELNISVPTFGPYQNVKEKDKKTIASMREYRTELQNKLLKKNYQNDINKIQEAITMLSHIRKKEYNELTYKPSLELEKWANIALNILNDSIEIKPNTKVGDDNEPTSYAPAGVGDIECFYEKFNALCEVSTSEGRDQWCNESQPVIRHLDDFQTKHNKTSYCLFVAPKLHEDTINVFYLSNAHGYHHNDSKIIPITIKQLEEMLDVVYRLKSEGKNFTHDNLLKLYTQCTNTANIGDSNDWIEHVNTSFNTWKQNLLIFSSNAN